MNTHIVYSPFDQKPVGSLAFEDRQTVFSKLERAYRFFTEEGPSHWPKYKRIEHLQAFANLMEQHREDIIKTAIAEGGKPRKDTEIEWQRARNGIDVAIAALYSIHGEEIPMALTKAGSQHLAFTIKRPCGVVLSISAFNHPINLVIHQTVPAFAVGAPVLIKPSLKTPLTCKMLVDLMHRAGIPEDYITMIFCPDSITEELAQSPKLRFISFIGSYSVGYALRAKAAEGVRVGLEHGGAAPVIITESADLDWLIPRLVKAAFYHAGQVCVSAQRVFVQETVLDLFLDRFLQATRALKVGDPFDRSVDVGPLITREALERVRSWVDRAVQKGAKLLCGGETRDNLLTPTVLLEPPADCEVSCEEVFGPVLAVYRYREWKEAIEKANQTPFCFQSAIFTKDIDWAMQAMIDLDATTVLINEHPAFRVDWMPFGGARRSGLGRGGIPYFMQDLYEEKLIVLAHPSWRE